MQQTITLIKIQKHPIQVMATINRCARHINKCVSNDFTGYIDGWKSALLIDDEDVALFLEKQENPGVYVKFAMSLYSEEMTSEECYGEISGWVYGYNHINNVRLAASVLQTMLEFCNNDNSDGDNDNSDDDCVTIDHKKMLQEWMS